MIRALQAACRPALSPSKQKIGSEQFEKNINVAQTLSQVLFAHMQQQYPIHTIDGKTRFAKEISELLNTMPQGIFQKLLYKQLAKTLQIDEADLDQLIITSTPSKKQSETLQANLAQQTGMLPPALLASAILIQHPQLAKGIELKKDLQTIKAPGANLLRKLLQLLNHQATINVGQLLTYYNEPEQQKTISQLAARELYISEEGLKEELLGVIQRLKEYNRKKLIEELIKKAKLNEISLSEKQQLQALLSNNKEMGV